MYRFFLGVLAVLVTMPASTLAQASRGGPVTPAEVMAVKNRRQQAVQQATYQTAAAVEVRSPTSTTTLQAPAAAATRRGAVEAARLASASSAPVAKVSKCPYDGSVHGKDPCVCGYEGSTYLAVVKSDPSLGTMSPVELNNRIYGSQAQPIPATGGAVPYDTGHYYVNGQWVADAPMSTGGVQVVQGTGGFGVPVGRNFAPMGTSVWGPRGGHPFGGGSAGDYQRMARMRSAAIMRGFGSAGDWNRQATNRLNSYIRQAIPNGSLRGFNTWRAFPGPRGFTIPRLW